MAVLKATKTKQSLMKKGFIQDNSHHHYFEFWHNGKVIATTYTSHNNEDIDDFLIKAMSKQCLMDKPFFVEFIKCTKSQDDYITLLKSKGEIADIPIVDTPVKSIKKKKI
ncbi:MAG: hypothetical protein QM541_02145 [Flavobacterium sp.]|nr:hypothetical protein [Flavobacterium sp.]